VVGLLPFGNVKREPKSQENRVVFNCTWSQFDPRGFTIRRGPGIASVQLGAVHQGCKLVANWMQIECRPLAGSGGWTIQVQPYVRIWIRGVAELRLV
jgi:hypothetical protein